MFGKNKKPASVSAGGLDLLISCGRLLLAAAVRRHGGSMMVVMAVMVARLHLLLP
jgi:hypothetical protein